MSIKTLTGRTSVHWLIAALLIGCGWLTSVVAAAPAEVQSLMKKGELNAALKAADAGLKNDADNIELNFLRGLVLTRLERYEAAAKVFQSLIEEYPKLPEPYNNLAVVYAAQGQYDQARETLLRAINTHPSYATAYENIGDIYAKMASDAYNQALQLDTENVAAREKLALVNDLFPGGQPDTASTASRVGDSKQPEQTPAKLSADKQADKAAHQASPESGPAKPTAEMPGPVMSEAQLADSDKPETTTRPAAAPGRLQEQQAKPDPDTIIAAVQDWAAAWSDQDVEAYLDSYADDFLPPAGMSRKEWHAQRRERVSAPAYIKVTIDDIRMNALGSNLAQVRFSQDYQSDTYSDSVIKTLLMKQVDDRWLIAEEYSR